MIAFQVPGSPVPQGSGRALRIRRGPRRGKGVVIPDLPDELDLAAFDPASLRGTP